VKGKEAYLRHRDEVAKPFLLGYVDDIHVDTVGADCVKLKARQGGEGSMSGSVENVAREADGRGRHITDARVDAIVQVTTDRFNAEVKRLSCNRKNTRHLC
jgi:hypothetical protein